MTDDKLAELFTEGTAPERDARFARVVEARIGRARLAVRLLPVAVRALVLLVLASAVFLIGRAIETPLARIAEASPQFMGVPVPLILGVLVVGLAIRARRLFLLRAG